MMVYLTGWDMPRWFNKPHPRLCFRENPIVRVLICGRVWLLGSRILEWGGRAARDGPLGQCLPVELHLILPMVASLPSSHPGTLLCFLGTMTSHHMLLLPCPATKGPSQTARTTDWARCTQLITVLRQTGKTPGFSHSIYFTSKLCVPLAYP